MNAIEIKKRNSRIRNLLREQTARHQANPAEARAFLMRLGFWNEDGTLKEEFGGDPISHEQPTQV